MTCPHSSFEPEIIAARSAEMIDAQTTARRLAIELPKIARADC